MSIEKFNMPVGRIVSGNPTSWEDAVDYHTKQKKLNKGCKEYKWQKFKRIHKK